MKHDFFFSNTKIHYLHMQGYVIAKNSFAAEVTFNDQSNAYLGVIYTVNFVPFEVSNA